MEESVEIWLMTSLSILVAVGVAYLVRWIFNILLLSIDATFESDRKYDQTSLRNYITRTKMLRNTSEFGNAAISNFMLVVGTYEKVLLVTKDMWFEYYITTVVLGVIFAYTLQKSSPNPLTCISRHWDKLIRKEEVISTMNANNNNLSKTDVHDKSSTNGVRRRGGEGSAVELDVPSGDLTVSKRRRPHDSVWAFFYFSGPTLLGQFLGLHAAIVWLHFAWDGYLTDHHVANTEKLRKCLICLTTGPIQGMIIEAAITFFFSVCFKWLRNRPDDSPLNFVSRSYFWSSCAETTVATIVLYIFIKITGAFANPLLAYALERECLYDVTTVVNHILVYTVGGLMGVVAFKTIPQPKHWPLVGSIFVTFASLYLFFPGILDKNLFRYGF